MTEELGVRFSAGAVILFVLPSRLAFWPSCILSNEYCGALPPSGSDQGVQLTTHLKIKSVWSYTSTKVLRFEVRCRANPLNSYLFNGRMELGGVILTFHTANTVLNLTRTWSCNVKNQSQCCEISVMMYANVFGIKCLIQEGPLSKLSQHTNYPDWGLLWVSSAPAGKSQNNILIQTMATSFHVISKWSFLKHSTVWFI